MSDYVTIAMDLNCPLCDYPETFRGLSLAQSGEVEPVDEGCRKCGWHMEIIESTLMRYLSMTLRSSDGVGSDLVTAQVNNPRYMTMYVEGNLDLGHLVQDLALFVENRRF